MKKIRILIADDHALFRERTLLNAMSGIEIVGEAADGEAAVAQVAIVQPDVVLMDINMPGVNGSEATRRILSTHPKLDISAKTVSNHITNIFSKLQVADRAQAIIRARDAGLG